MPKFYESRGRTDDHEIDLGREGIPFGQVRVGEKFLLSRDVHMKVEAAGMAYAAHMETGELFPVGSDDTVTIVSAFSYGRTRLVD